LLVDIRTRKKEFSGDGFMEQIKTSDGPAYAFYHPADEHIDHDRITTDTFQPAPRESEEDPVIHYIPLKRCPWLPSGEPMPPEEDLWEQVYYFIEAHVDLPDERLYHLVTSWISEAWTSVPYLQIIGPKNSGKTRLLEVLQHLVYRGILTPNLTEATTFRIIEKFRPVFLIDEAEVLGSESKQIIQNLLNSGYRRGQLIPRMKPGPDGGYDIDFFDAFGFKALASTGGFKGTPESRSILITMEKNLRKINPYIDSKTATGIRSQLLWWRWRRLVDLTTDNTDVTDVSQRDTPPELSFADGRFLELYTPLIAVSNHGKNDILSYAKEQYNQHQEDEKMTVEATILDAILKTYPELENGKIPVKLVTEKLNENVSDKDQWKTRSVGRIMKRLGLQATRLNDGLRGYHWIQNKIERLAKRYGVYPDLMSVMSETSVDLEQVRFIQEREDMFNKQTSEVTE